MSAHLAYVPKWVECICSSECIYGTKVDEEPDKLNSLPLEWTEELYLGKVSHLFPNGRIWLEDGQFHRERGPAIIRSDSSVEWWKRGERHRADGPAVLRLDGSQIWYKEGKIHNDNGPAITWADNSKEWWVNGSLHREDGPAILNPDGTEEWYKNGNRQHK